MMYSIFALIISLVLGFGATDGHPFWVVTDEPDLSRAASDYSDGMYHGSLEPGLNGYWVEAKDLREGDVFLGANGELSTLVATERVQFDETIKVYNFTVDGNHDYFVIAATDEFGQTCVLVHNAWYNIDDGVHRAAVARNLGMDNIHANIYSRDGALIEKAKEIPIKDLLSPRNTLVPERYARALAERITSPEAVKPITVTQVTVPRYISIMDVHLP